MWDQTTKSDLVEGIARAERLKAVLASPIGDDIRALIINVAQIWLEKVKKGEVGTHNGLLALDDFVGACDLSITLGEGMKMELTRRNGDNYARAAAD